MSEEAGSPEDFEKESRKIGAAILQWLSEMPQADDLHKMLISVAAVSTADNKVELTEKSLNAISEWAQMLCQNLEMVTLFHRGMLVARADENGELAVDFTPEAAAIIEKAQKEAE